MLAEQHTVVDEAAAAVAGAAGTEWLLKQLEAGESMQLR